MAVEISVSVCENHWFQIRWICHWHGDDVLSISCDLSWVMLRAAIVCNNSGVRMLVMVIWHSGKVAHQREGTTSILNVKDTAAGQQALVLAVWLQLAGKAVITQGFTRSTDSPPFGLLRDLLNEFRLASCRTRRPPTSAPVADLEPAAICQELVKGCSP